MNVTRISTFNIQFTENAQTAKYIHIINDLFLAYFRDSEHNLQTFHHFPSALSFSDIFQFYLQQSENVFMRINFQFEDVFKGKSICELLFEMAGSRHKFKSLKIFF